MSALMRSPAAKRIAVLSLLLAIVAAGFWSSSRYPDLDGKAVMGESAGLEDPLSFEALITIQPGDSAPRRVLYSTINWLNTNRRGMAFGVCVAAIVLSIMSLLERRGFRSGLGNTALGVAIGAPLGLCVNCAAPLAKGVHEAGGRLETTLATMTSSPTLNAVVLSMTFGILPFYLAMTKIAFTLLYLFAVIPLLSRYVFREEVATSILTSECAIPELALLPSQESWGEATLAAGRDLAKHFWFIVRKTIPLMFLAALLGALSITLLPLDMLTGLGVGFFTMVMVAVVGLFLPVPIAFDVILCATLLGAGTPATHVMILLFTLGVFSIYSFMIVYGTVSPRVAWTVAASLALMGIASGLTASMYDKHEYERLLVSVETEAYTAASAPEETAAVDARVFVAGTATRGVESAGFVRDNADVQVTSRDDMPRSPRGKHLFTRYEAAEFGIWRPNTFAGEDFWQPFFNGRGIAAGDFNNDGWVDIALGAKKGIYLFANRGGSFERVSVDFRGLNRLNVFAVALVDIDNDGWLDIFLTTYGDGNYYLLNDSGEFGAERFYPIPSEKVSLTSALSFGDIDRDGFLDVALGNWHFGLFGPAVPPAATRNRLLFNEGGGFSGQAIRKMEGIPGETLSVLLSDFNGDGHLDLIVGNDFKIPDYFYLGDGEGDFRMIVKSDDLVQRSGETTMSLDVADINNDLIPDIYVAQIALRATGKAVEIVERPFEDYCSDIENGAERNLCERNISLKEAFKVRPADALTDIKECHEVVDQVNKSQGLTCRAMWMMQVAYRRNESKLCSRMPKGQDRIGKLCQKMFHIGDRPDPQERASAVRQIANQNVMLIGSADGRFVDVAEEQGIEITGWSWNAKFADLDNDEWQDLYVANGSWTRKEGVESNFFFANDEGKGFRILTDEYGLTDHMIVSAYAYVDIDNDGDLDVVTNAINGPMRVFVNNDNSNASIAFELRDEAGNYFGIGGKITISYGIDGEKRQVRELKSGGGYLSFDPLVAHFGLGEFREVAGVEVTWSTGEHTELTGPFSSGALHTITRRAPAAQDALKLSGEVR